ncbi:MAG: polysaccharide deacetylase family protein [Rhodocyclaceae bacterium]
MKTAKAIPVLMYHHVSPNPGLVTVSPENFRAQMRYLAEHGWHTLTLDDLARFLAGKPMPAKSVVITFDDGYLDNWVYAHPIMAEYGLHGAIFIVTGWIGNGPSRPHAGAKVGAEGTASLPPTPNHKDCKAAIAAGRADEVMLRWSEIEAMRAAGTFEFHSHTHTHTRWDLIEPDPETRYAKLAADLNTSRETLQARLGKASRHLCWPWGHYQDDFIGVAQATGFDYLYTTDAHVNVRGSRPEQIGRFVAKDKDGAWLFRRVQLYAHPWLARYYRWLHG